MKSLRSHPVSIVTLIDRHEPEYANFAELSARPELKVRTPEAGISGHLGFSHPRVSAFSWKYFAIVVALFLAGAYVAWKEIVP